MAVNRVPVLKRCRSLGLDPIYLGIDKKSTRQLKRANRKMSEYGLQLREKQKAKFIYGSCPILFMFHQEPFLLIHQNIILGKQCSFLSFDFISCCINGKSGISGTFDCEKFWNDNESVFINIVGCGFSLIRDYQNIATSDGMTFEVLRSLFLQAYFYIRRSFPDWILPMYTC